MNTWTPKSIIILGGVAVVGLWFVKRQATETVKDVGQAINPVNRDNVINKGAQSVWDQFTDGQGTIGTDIYDWLNPADELPEG